MNEKQKSPMNGNVVGQYLEMAIKSSGKTKRAVAAEAGFKRANIISMLCNGELDLPLNRVTPIANAVGIDPIALMFMVLRENHPELHLLIQSALGDRLFSREEASLIDTVRMMTGTTVSGPTNNGEVAALRAYCDLIKRREGSVGQDEIPTETGEVDGDDAE